MGISDVCVIPVTITCTLQGVNCDTGIPHTFYGGNICSVLISKIRLSQTSLLFTSTQCTNDSYAKKMSTLQMFPPKKVWGIPVSQFTPCKVHVIVTGITHTSEIPIIFHFWYTCIYCMKKTCICYMISVLNL